MITKPEKPHLSATALDMFWKCPEQYRRRYIEGERVPPGIALMVGKGLHGGAEVNFRQKIASHADLSPSEIMEAAAAAFDAEQAGGYELTPEEMSVGCSRVLGEAKDKVVALAAAHAREQAPDYQPVAVEHTTRIVFPKATHDLLAVTDLRDDRDRVTDFKSSAKKKAQSEADTSTQLTIYDAAFRIECGRPPAEVRLDVLTKAKTPARQVLVSHRSQVDLQVLVNRVNVTLNAINRGCFPPATPGAWWCHPRWCGFARTCPYQNSERLSAAERNDSE